MRHRTRLVVDVSFDCFIGIDQTGAAVVRGGSRARPLHCAVMARAGPDRWRLVVERRGEPLRLAAVDPESLEGLLLRCGVRAPWSSTAILADCVLGLPMEVWSDEPGSGGLWRTMQRAAGCRAYGMGPGQEFFDALLGMGAQEGVPPRRRCEVLANATSVFRTVPWQKNIQTGTFRIWRDMAAQGRPRWLNVWPFETERSWLRDGGWIFEAFPSLMWRSVLGLDTRDRSRLLSAARAVWLKHGWNVVVRGRKLIETHADVADAAVLAFAGAVLQERGTLLSPYASLRGRGERLVEGWIAGLGAEG